MPWPAAYAAYLAGVGIRIGQSREFGGSLLTHWLLPAEDDEARTRSTGRCGMSERGRDPVGRNSELELKRPTSRPGEGPYVLLAPGASAPSRRYPEYPRP